jgi:outer membrane protein TolC
MKRIAAILVALLACACASDGADIEPMIPQNAAGAFVGMRRGDFTRDMAPDEWWRLYDDRVLDALIAQAFAENRDLAIAAANLRQVRASLQEARSLRFPSTVTSGTAQRVREPALGPIPATETDFFDIGLDISYEVDFFGRVRSIISAARADTEAAEAALDVVRVSVAAETARAYADACAANATIAVAERTARLQQSTLELTQKLLNGGRGTGLSVASAAAQVHTTRATIPPLRAALDEAVFRLATLTGRPPAEASAEARACARIPQLRQPIPVGDGAALLARRPDIRRAGRSFSDCHTRRFDRIDRARAWRPRLFAVHAIQHRSAHRLELSQHARCAGAIGARPRRARRRLGSLRPGRASRFAGNRDDALRLRQRTRPPRHSSGGAKRKRRGRKARASSLSGGC